MEMKNEMLAYETPQVEIIEVEVEKGFAASPDKGDGTGSGDDYTGGWG